MERYINAYDFAEVIENLDITVAGKPARWNDAKYTVLKELAEAPTADVAPRAEVEYLKEHLEMWCNKHKKAREEIERLESKIAQYQLDLHYSVCREDEAKENVATKIFEELEYLSMDGRIPMNGYYAELKKRYTEGQK